MNCLIREITLQMNHPIVRRTVGGAHQGSFTSYASSDLEKDINLISLNVICVEGGRCEVVVIGINNLCLVVQKMPSRFSFNMFKCLRQQRHTKELARMVRKRY